MYVGWLRKLFVCGGEISLPLKELNDHNKPSQMEHGAINSFNKAVNWTNKHSFLGNGGNNEIGHKFLAEQKRA